MAKIICNDCGKDIDDSNKGAKYPSGKMKCIDCYEKEPNLTQKTEVYSRVVGYLRPMNQWNLGKLSEKARRKDFKMPTQLSQQG